MRSVEQVLMELTPIFRDALNNERLVLTAEMSARGVDGWDSFTHMRLIVAIEQHYGIHFRLKDLLTFENVGDMCGEVLRLTR